MDTSVCRNAENENIFVFLGEIGSIETFKMVCYSFLDIQKKDGRIGI